MRWLVYSIAVSLVASGSLVASSKSKSPESAEQERPAAQTEDEDFVPSEKVPADSAISFPVDI
jgi:hypothetical protein